MPVVRLLLSVTVAVILAVSGCATPGKMALESQRVPTLPPPSLNVSRSLDQVCKEAKNRNGNAETDDEAIARLLSPNAKGRRIVVSFADRPVSHLPIIIEDSANAQTLATVTTDKHGVASLFLFDEEFEPKHYESLNFNFSCTVKGLPGKHGDGGYIRVGDIRYDVSNDRSVYVFELVEQVVENDVIRGQDLEPVPRRVFVRLLSPVHPFADGTKRICKRMAAPLVRRQSLSNEMPQLPKRVYIDTKAHNVGLSW